MAGRLDGQTIGFAIRVFRHSRGGYVLAQTRCVSLPVVALLVDELVDRYQYLGAAALRREIDAAIRDLTGSVRDDALPEMAMRLTIFRLDYREQQSAGLPSPTAA